MPPLDTSGSARRFSSTVTFQQGPHSAEALDGALRLATPFSYTNDASHVLFNSPFCVSLISLYSALRVLTLMKLRHLRNLRNKTGLTIVHLVSSLPVTAYTPVPLGLVDSTLVKFIYTKIPWNLENLNSTRNPQVR